MLLSVVSVSDSCITFLRPPRRLLCPPMRGEGLADTACETSAVLYEESAIENKKENKKIQVLLL